MIDNIDEFVSVLNKYLKTDSIINMTDEHLFCTKCNGNRRVSISTIIPISTKQLGELPHSFDVLDVPKSTPGLFNIKCLDCREFYTVLFYWHKKKPTMIVLPSYPADAGTPNTDEDVKYYLDQAYRSQFFGANSAAVAMYRSALEMLLFKKGYKMRMLGPKVEKLEKDRKAGTAKKWAMELNPYEIKLIKKLAESAIHPNDGDTSKQSVFNDKVLNGIKTIFKELLYKVYEKEKEEKENLQILEEAEKALEPDPFEDEFD